MPKFDFGSGSAPDPAGGAYSAPPDPLAGGEGLAAPVQSRFAETRFAEMPTLTLNPNFGESGFDETGSGESGRHQLLPPQEPHPCLS